MVVVLFLVLEVLVFLLFLLLFLLLLLSPSLLLFFFFFNDTATTEIYTLSYTLSLHDALPICHIQKSRMPSSACDKSEEHTSELQSHSEISYAVLCLKQKTQPGLQESIRLFRSTTRGRYYHTST